jgi:hypothetical protein
MSNTEARVSEACLTQPYPRSGVRWSVFNSLKSDLFVIGICVAVVSYLLIKESSLLLTFGFVSILFLSPWQLIKAIPFLKKYLGVRLRFWHLVTIIITLTALLHTFVAPAHAIFLSGLEQFFVTLAQQTSQAGGATNTLDANVIRLIFNLIRGVFLLLVAAAALFAYNQAQQGNDWRPIVTQVGLAFAIVIAIDVVTFIFVGNGTGAAG